MLEERILSMKRLMTVVVFMIVCAAALKANSFTWTDTGTGFFASGTLNATNIGGGVYVANSGTGTATGSIFNGDSLTLWAGANNGSTQYSPSGLFYFDNLLFPNSYPVLDSGGLLFIGTTSGGDLNIWGNGPDSPYSTWTEVGGSYILTDNNSTFTLAPVLETGSFGTGSGPGSAAQAPEPSALVLLGSGLIALARKMKRKIAS